MNLRHNYAAHDQKQRIVIKTTGSKINQYVPWPSNVTNTSIEY